MSFYQRHIFFCTNYREGADACGHHGAHALCDYARRRLSEIGLAQASGVRISRAGCLGRCTEGPALVIYPDAVWYSYLDASDIDAIIDEHVRNGSILARLALPDRPHT